MLKWRAIVDIDVDVNVAAHQGWGGGHGGAEPRGGGCLGNTCLSTVVLSDDIGPSEF